MCVWFFIEEARVLSDAYKSGRDPEILWYWMEFQKKHKKAHPRWESWQWNLAARQKSWKSSKIYKTKKNHEIVKESRKSRFCWEYYHQKVDRGKTRRTWNLRESGKGKKVAQEGKIEKIVQSSRQAKEFWKNIIMPRRPWIF